MITKIVRGLMWVGLCAGVTLSAEVLFQHQTFKDFSKGTVSDAGANLYVSREGRIQFINLFDLNGDGHPELVINNDHNTHDAPDVLIYHNRRPGGLRSLTHPMSDDAPAYENLKWTLDSLSRITRLPSQGGGKAVLADLNGDGYKELLFTNFIHGSTLAPMPVYLYWGAAEGFDPTRRSVLAADRGTGLAVADLTGDGLMDIVVSNAGREHLVSLQASKLPHEKAAEIAGIREKCSYVFRQTEAGFTPEAVEVVSTLFAIDVKAADLDRNGSQALIFLETGRPGALRILRRENGKWGAPQLLPVLAPAWRRTNRELLVKDFNGDGYPDIFVPSTGSHSEIFWNDRGKFSEKNRTILEVENAGGADAGDLNDDGYVDLVIASNVSPEKIAEGKLGTSSSIWWGSKAGFSHDRRTELPTIGAVSAQLADVNGTGRLDILFGQHSNRETFDATSYVYLNSPTGFSPENRLELQGFGTNAMLAEDLDGDGLKEVVLVNGQSGIARHDGAAEEPGAAGGEVNGLPLYIFRGNADGRFGSASLIRVPEAASETGLAFADMEDNGKAALVYLRNGGRRVVIRHDIYHYPRVHESSQIELPFQAMGVNVADFNRDGILDILALPYIGQKGAVIFGLGNRKYWLQAFAFNQSVYSSAIGDLDHDGVLDAVTGGPNGICILRGSNDGVFHFGPPTVLASDFFASRVSLADFDGKGGLDILCQNIQNFTTKSYDVESWILLNQQGSFSLQNKRSFRTFGAQGGTIARFRADGPLDIVMGNYQGNLSRRPALFLLHGGKDGFPANENKTRLPASSASATLVLDFNGDGFQDIAVSNHMGVDVYNGDLAPAGGEHGIGSLIYWGDKKGFSPENKTWIPSFGPHSRITVDAGSVSKREPFEMYTSDYLVNRAKSGKLMLTLTGRFNQKQHVTPEIILGKKNAAAELAEPPVLQARSATNASYLVSIPPGQTFRYRLRLNSSYTGAGPMVSAVKLEESSGR